MKKNFNHNPFVVGVSVPFNGCRFKNPYLITDKDGNKYEGVPNGGGWHVSNGSIIEDSEVKHIQPIEAHDAKWHCMPGGWRVARDIDMFGKNYPMWCGEEHGFLYPDEIPEGHTAIPVSLYAYKDKKDKLAVPTIFVAQAKIIKVENPSVRYGTVEDIQQYVNHPAFWMDPNSSVLSNDEIMFSIYQLVRFNKELVHKERDAKELIKLFEDLGIDELKYVPAFSCHLRHFVADKRFYADMLRNIPETFNTANTYLKDNAKSNLLSSYINSKRAPLRSKVEGPDWNILSDVILSPLEYPDLWIGKKALVIKRPGYKRF